jgi:hypothetical protein
LQFSLSGFDTGLRSAQLNLQGLVVDYSQGIAFSYGSAFLHQYRLQDTTDFRRQVNFSGFNRPGSGDELVFIVEGTTSEVNGN